MKEWKEGRGMGESSVESDKNRIQTVSCLQYYYGITVPHAIQKRNTTCACK